MSRAKNHIRREIGEGLLELDEKRDWIERAANLCIGSGQVTEIDYLLYGHLDLEEWLDIRMSELWDEDDGDPFLDEDDVCWGCGRYDCFESCVSI